MAIVFSPGVIEIAVVQSYAGTTAVNVWHMLLDSETFGPGAEAVVEDFRDNWQDHMALLQANDVVYERFEWRSLDAGSGAAGIVLPNPSKSATGTQTGAALPPNVAGLVHKTTSDRPRGRRDGRCFLVGLEEGIVTEGGLLDSTWRAAANAALDDFYNGISDSAIGAGGDSYPVVLETTEQSRAPGSASVTIGSRRVTSITIDPKVATQRERLR